MGGVRRPGISPLGADFLEALRGLYDAAMLGERGPDAAGIVGVSNRVSLPFMSRRPQIRRRGIGGPGLASKTRRRIAGSATASTAPSKTRSAQSLAAPGVSNRRFHGRVGMDRTANVREVRRAAVNSSTVR